MTDLADPRLSAWESFYVIVGSSGGALIGVQFVVITLVAAMRRRTFDSINAFATPTMVHFSGALLISAIMSAPWRSPSPASAALAACGLGGLVYGAIVVRRARRQTDYRPVWEDWIWYAILPSTAYTALGLAALLLSTTTEAALTVIGGAALGLLVVGIHNAWDSVTHIVVSSAQDDSTTRT